MDQKFVAWKEVSISFCLFLSLLSYSLKFFTSLFALSLSFSLSPFPLFLTPPPFKGYGAPSTDTFTLWLNFLRPVFYTILEREREWQLPRQDGWFSCLSSIIYQSSLIPYCSRTVVQMVQVLDLVHSSGELQGCCRACVKATNTQEGNILSWC